MNKIIFLFLTCFFLGGSYSTAQWEILNEGFKGYIRTIDFVDEYTGWMAGDNGTLLITSDGGENWSYIPFPVNLHIGYIDFLNFSTGWAVGAGDVHGTWINFIWKTTDGGQSWEEQYSSIDYGMNTVFAIDDQNAFAAGGNKMYRTTNGGVTWVFTASGIANREYNSLWFRDSQNGLAGGIYTGEPARGIIFKTTDGGLSWVEKFFGFYGIYDLQFTDNTTGYFRTNNDSVFFLCMTTDSGDSWKTVAQSRYGIPTYHTANDGSVCAVIADSNGNNIMKSTDKGINWQLVQTISNLNSCNLYIFGMNLGFIIGEIGWIYPFLFRSTDLEDWKLQKFSFPLNDVSFFNRDQGLIVGGWPRGFHMPPGGCIFITNNGGMNLTLSSQSVLNYQSCLSLDENTGFVSGTGSGSGSIFKFTNSGNKWTEYSLSDTLGNFFQVSDICFADINTGFAAGWYNFNFGESYGAGIMQTTDQGETWELIFRYPNVNDNWYNLSSLCFTGITGWAVGERGNYNDGKTSGVIFKYTPQTGWVKKDSLTDLPLRKVFFTDENHGWISGGDVFTNRILLRTTNGGATWQLDKKLAYLINDFCFIDNLHGWAVGGDSLDKGVILESIDGGETWTVEMDNLIAPLKSIYIKDNFAWTVGDNGLILRNTTDIVRLEVEKNHYPSEFILEQNYPNPFNPTTVISYHLPVISNVRLKVFDILGKEAAVLVNEVKQPGVYQVEFDGDNLASGIYFYRLQTEQYTSIKKMLLLK